jgi:hypothetical protein
VRAAAAFESSERRCSKHGESQLSPRWNVTISERHYIIRSAGCRRNTALPLCSVISRDERMTKLLLRSNGRW